MHCLQPCLFYKPEGCAGSLPVGPGLFCKLTMPSGSGHCSAPAPYCTTYCWRQETRRRLLDWVCRTTLSWTDKREVCETWSPSVVIWMWDIQKKLYYCTTVMNVLTNASFNPSTRWQGKAVSLQLAVQTFKKDSQALCLLNNKARWGGAAAFCICWWSTRDGASVNTKTCHHAALWTWY